MTWVDGEEKQYLDLIRYIIQNGEQRSERTGTGTLSIFAPPQLRFSLSTFPLLTTKKMYLRPIFEELMWFVRGQTNAKVLGEKNVHIWDQNGSRDYLDAAGLVDNIEGDLGPIYGFQWRHFGAPYHGCDADYTDQDKPILSCQLYQRSCDMGLGVPFNIASYSLLVMMIANVCGFEVGQFVHCMGDTHIYCDHTDALHEQITREPLGFPQLRINSRKVFRAVGESEDQYTSAVVQKLEGFEFTDFELIAYQSHAKLSMKMSA